MATLTIRNLPQEVHDQLRLRAASNRRSMESEAREVLKEKLLWSEPTPDQQQAIRELEEMGRAWRAKVNPPEGWSFIDQDVAERHLERAWENDKVTDAERQDWLTRLNAFEVTPAELERFVDGRIG